MVCKIADFNGEVEPVWREFVDNEIKPVRIGGLYDGVVEFDIRKGSCAFSTIPICCQVCSLKVEQTNGDKALVGWRKLCI